MRISDTAGAPRSPLSRVAFALLVLAAVMILPYFIPAPYSISHSWVAGFSNRAAIAIFALGATLFAAYTRGRLSSRLDERDSPLPWRALAVACVLTFAASTALCWPAYRVLPGYESIYFLNRVQMLNTGLHPYRDFEFAYGPLLLYPVLWAARLLHMDITAAYDVVWTLFWQIGVVLVWFTVRSLDVPVPRRERTFYLLFSLQLSIIIIAGISYSAVRTYAAAAAVAGAYTVWKRSGSLWLTAVASVLAVAAVLACAVEQAVGCTAGCATLLLLLAARQPRRSWVSLVAAFVGWLVCWEIASHFGALETLRVFGSGGYSDPVLPSLTILVVLFTYMACACSAAFAWRSYRRNDGQVTLVLPLSIAGLALLPSAMGRCDLLHIPLAIPALVVGVAAIAGQPAVRRWWLPAFLLTVVLVPSALFWTAYHVYLGPKTNSDPALLAQGFTRPVSDSQWYTSDPRISVAELPCDRTYFSPAWIPEPQKPFNPHCLGTGYYDGFTNLATQEGIARKLGELKQHVSDPLIMQPDPLEAQLPLQFVAVDQLRLSELFPWAPPARNKPLTYAPINAFIRTHWTPGPFILNGRLRVWNPVVTR